MKSETVTLFKPYDFTVGQKIRIENGPRRGDWKVVGTTDRKITLQCPISQKTFEWNRFCYVVEELEGAEWPGKDENA
ncbi:MAG: hypothetical protein JRE21_02545 [Deltaproteobacteria bacterium]|jgi:hypothetical protein|nr:hypothetical protein [Deltaproteobacteria bacterium]